MLDRAALEKTYYAAAELERRRAAAPCLYVHEMIQGHPKQREFLEATKTHRKVFLFGANQSGKTWIGRAYALALALGYRYYEVPDLCLTETGDLPAREAIPRKYWIMRCDGIPITVPNIGAVITGLKRSIGIGENIWPAFNTLVPEAWRTQRLPFKAMKGSLGTPENVTLPNGSKILFFCEEMESWVFEGFVAQWMWVDEPVRQEIFNSMHARLMASSGPMIFTLTPLGTRSAWMLDIVNNPPADTHVLTVVQTDNPGLSEEQRQAFANNQQWTTREKRARIYGEFEVLGDRVFEEYEPAVHKLKPFMPAKDLIHGMTVDPHFKRPAFVVWWAFDSSTRTYYFYREWPVGGDFSKMRSGGLAPAEYATVFRNAEGRVPCRVRIVDPRFGRTENTRHGFKDTCWVDLMAEFGFHFDANVPNTGTIEFGHQVIQKLLHYNKEFPAGPTNKPHLFITDDCPNLDRAFRNYGFLDVSDPVKGLYKKVSEEYKDGIDAVRYTVLYPIPATAAQISSLQRYTPEQLERENNEF